jgi:hypothetical protein
MAKRSGMKQNSKVVWPGFSEVETRHVSKVGRNEPCPCGSGKKYKDCHEKEGDAYLKKLAFEKDKERVRELRRRMKEEGVPWWKRLFLRA